MIEHFLKIKSEIYEIIEYYANIYIIISGLYMLRNIFVNVFRKDDLGFQMFRYIYFGCFSCYEAGNVNSFRSLM